ncbi:MAG: T9SS type A sorting domain-containing protein [Bacteroidia bacterium]|nr:T9SS type A sorting domain-containing protein [Bacteroidia bacterium]
MKNKIIILISAFLFVAGLSAQPVAFQSRGIGGGGALFFPTVNPANDNEFYVSCDMSQLFHTTDFGNSYTQLPFSKLQVDGHSNYLFTNDPLIAYSSYYKPFKTIDGGATWTAINTYNTGTYGDVYKMSANYNNPAQIIVGAYGDILFSGNGGSTFSLIKHTSNNGAGIILSGVFWEGSNIYVATNEGLFYSTNSGTSFSLMATTGIAAGEVIWSFAAANNGGASRFVCITSSLANTYNGINPWEYSGHAKGVYTMNNASGTWTTASSGINISNDYIMYVGMAENDISTIYLGGSDKALNSPLVFKSTDGGTSWNKTFKSTNNSNIKTGWEGTSGDKAWSFSETCFGITVAPNNSNKVLFSTFSSVEVSSDGAASWKQAYINNADQHTAGSITPKQNAYHSIGLENTTCWQIHWQSPSKMMGCFSDIGGIRSIDTGKSWGYQYSGFAVNSLYRLAKTTDGRLFGGCSGIHDMYQSTRLQDVKLDASDASGKIIYSTDSGTTWKNVHTFNHPVFWLAADPNNINRMYASVIHYGGTQGSQLGGIYRTNDLNNYAASTWTKLPNPPRTEGHPATIEVLKDGKVVCTFSGRRNPSGTFTASSGVFLYDTATNAWTDVSHPDMKYWCKDIVIDPNDATQSTWYVAVFSGWGGAPNGLGGLFRTTNRGTNWTKLTGTLFDRVTSITFDPLNLKQAYLTTETNGLWMSSNMNAVTPTWSLVNSYIFRQPERVFFNPYKPGEMWVSSFGNGMKIGVNDNSTSKVNAIVNDNNIILYPNPSGSIINVRFRENISEKVTVEIYTINGSVIKTSDYNFSINENELAIDGSQLAKGMYYLKLNSDKNTVCKTFILE